MREQMINFESNQSTFCQDHSCKFCPSMSSWFPTSSKLRLQSPFWGRQESLFCKTQIQANQFVSTGRKSRHRQGRWSRRGQNIDVARARDSRASSQMSSNNIRTRQCNIAGWATHAFLISDIQVTNVVPFELSSELENSPATITGDAWQNMNFLVARALPLLIERFRTSRAHKTFVRCALHACKQRTESEGTSR